MSKLTIRQYRTGNDVVEAVQLTRTNGPEVWEWADSKPLKDAEGNVYGLRVYTPTGNRNADFGDWIVRYADSFYPVKPDTFAAAYTAAEEVPMSETMTPAQELRAAAKKICDTAVRAEAGPWMADGSEIYGPAMEWVGETLQSDNDLLTSANSAHIALWHPDVAQLVANWLIGTAALEEQGVRSVPSQALDLARAINGGAA